MRHELKQSSEIIIIQKVCNSIISCYLVSLSTLAFRQNVSVNLANFFHFSTK